MSRTALAAGALIRRTSGARNRDVILGQAVRLDITRSQLAHTTLGNTTSATFLNWYDGPLKFNRAACDAACWRVHPIPIARPSE